MNVTPVADARGGRRCGHEAVMGGMTWRCTRETGHHGLCWYDQTTDQERNQL